MATATTAVTGVESLKRKADAIAADSEASERAADADADADTLPTDVGASSAAASTSVCISGRRRFLLISGFVCRRATRPRAKDPHPRLEDTRRNV